MSENYAKDLDECSLCLTVAENPVICQKGHIFCKSCIYDNLLTQKERYKQHLAAYEEQCAEDLRRQEVEKQHGMLKDTLTFQSIDTSLTGTVQDRTVASTFSSLTGKASSTDALSLNNTSQIKDMIGSVPHAPQGYRVVPTNDKNYVFVRCGDTGANWTMVDGKNERNRLEKPNTDCVCPSGAHPLKVKHLVGVSFTPYNDVNNDIVLTRKKAAGTNETQGAQISSALIATDSDAACIRDVTQVKKARHMCPSCLRGLTKHTASICVRRCGHVLCAQCYNLCMLKPAKESQAEKKVERDEKAGKEMKDRKKDSDKDRGIPMTCAECDLPCWTEDIIFIRDGK